MTDTTHAPRRDRESYLAARRVVCADPEATIARIEAADLGTLDVFDLVDLAIDAAEVDMLLASRGNHEAFSIQRGCLAELARRVGYDRASNLITDVELASVPSARHSDIARVLASVRKVLS